MAEIEAKLEALKLEEVNDGEEYTLEEIKEDVSEVVEEIKLEVAEVVEEVKDVFSADEEITLSVKVCPSCGAPAGDEDLFCGECGAKIGE